MLNFYFPERTRKRFIYILTSFSQIIYRLSRINKHRPLRAMGRTLAIFSEEDIDLTKGKGYNIKKTDFVGIECMEIFRC